MKNEDRIDELLRTEENIEFDKTFVFRAPDAAESSVNARRTKRSLAAASAILAVVIAAGVAVFAFRPWNKRVGDEVADESSGSSVQVIEGNDSRDKEGKSDPGSGSESVDISEPVSEPVSEEEPSKPDAGVYVEIPEWYAPGNLFVKTVTVEPVQALSPAFVPAVQAQNLALDLVSGPRNIVGSRYLDVTGLLASSEHKNHGWVFYDTEKGEVVCYECIVKELIADSIGPNDVIAIDNVTTCDLLSFALVSRADSTVKQRWIYDFRTSQLRETPVISESLGTFTLSPDLCHAAVNVFTAYDGVDDAVNPYRDDVYLIDLETLEYREVSEGRDTFAISAFSPDGRNLLAAMKNAQGSTYGFENENCIFLLVNAYTGASCECAGKVLSYKDGLLVTCSAGVYRVYDRENCVEITPEEDVFAWDTRNGSLILVNARNGEETVLGPAPEAECLSPDGCYLFTYTTGDVYLECRSLDGGSFRVDVSKEFAEKMTDLQRTHHIFYKISVNDAMDEALISYYATEIQIIEDDPEVDYYHLMLSSLVDLFEQSYSIADMYEKLVQTAPDYDYGFVLYKGAGYVYLNFDISHTHNRSETVSVIEDYRNNTFTAFRDYGKRGFPLSRTYGDARVVKLSSTEEQTLAFVTKNKIKTKDADMDYALFLKNGKFKEDNVPYLKSYIREYEPYVQKNVKAEVAESAYLKLIECVNAANDAEGYRSLAYVIKKSGLFSKYTVKYFRDAQYGWTAPYKLVYEAAVKICGGKFKKSDSFVVDEKFRYACITLYFRECNVYIDVRPHIDENGVLTDFEIGAFDIFGNW